VQQDVRHLLGAVNALRALAGATLVAVGAACGSSAPSESADSNLIGGEKASEGALPATLYLRSGCTAAKVGPSLILTAAHCVYDTAIRDVASTMAPGSHLFVTNHVSAPADQSAYLDLSITEVTIQPDWLAQCAQAFCADPGTQARLPMADVAVIEVAPTDAWNAIPIAPVARAAVATGDAVTLLGFGCEDGARLDHARGPVALKSFVTAVVGIAAAHHDGSFLKPGDDASASADYFLTPGPALAQGGAGLCPGDSGGPVYKALGDGVAIVGINSNYTFRPESVDPNGVPVTNWHTRLDDQSKFKVGAWLASLGVTTKP
jgi:hypothetical protein